MRYAEVAPSTTALPSGGDDFHACRSYHLLHTGRSPERVRPDPNANNRNANPNLTLTLTLTLILERLERFYSLEISDTSWIIFLRLRGVYV
eukprot:1334911-Amorphochlora_amoeboformis.AAC.1